MEKWFTKEFWQTIMQQTTEWAITSLPTIILILVLALVAMRVVNYALRKFQTVMMSRMKNNTSLDPEEVAKRMETLVGILTAAVKVLVWAMLIMILLREVGVDIAPLIAGAGIAGLAVGFGAQELVRDIISGFFMLLEDHVRRGDVAVVNGTGGLVETISLRTITLRDFSGTVHVFQNGKVDTLANMTKGWSAMVFDIGVAYKEDTDEVIEVIRQVGEELKADPEFSAKIIEPIEIFGVDKFGDSAVVVKARLKTKPIQQWVVGREFNGRLKKAFDAKGIEIPFPHRTIYWGEATGPLKLAGPDNGEQPAQAGGEA
ncbi:MAG: mechanosensitive ion channel family protein [Desulfatibacillaceae bacterium]